jgi:hypothetical protein
MTEREAEGAMTEAMEPVTREALQAGRQVYLRNDPNKTASKWVQWVETRRGPGLVVELGSIEFFQSDPSLFALVPVEPERREGWLNVYAWGCNHYDNKDDADHECKGIDPPRQGPAVRIPLIWDKESNGWKIDKDALEQPAAE